MSSLIDTTRAAFGPAPRVIETRDHLEPPRWMKPDDPLRVAYKRERHLLKSGDVVWGHVVQANSLLFAPGDANCPAQLVFGARAEDDVSPDRLMCAAQRLFALKGTTPEDPSLARLAQTMTDDELRHPPMDLPDVVTRGVAMRMAVVMIHRVHLPCGYLATCALPLVVSRDRAEVAVLPVRHWGPAMVAGWLDLSERQA